MPSVFRKSLSFNNRYFLLISLLLIILLLLTIIDLYTGPFHIPVSKIIKTIFGFKNSDENSVLIISEIRMPRVFTAILAGSALSVSGLQMQTIFRNPLAGPYVLGISSGASLGVAIMIMGAGAILNFEVLSNINNWSLIISACVGAGLVLLLIFAISVRINDIMTILILGILLGSAITSIVSILQYFSNAALLKSFIIWTLGSLSGVNSDQLKILALVVFIGLTIAILSSKILNVLLLGETYSKSLGLNIKLSRAVIFISTSLLAGSINAFCGPIGFIGIAVPHIAKMIFKTSNHNYLIPASIIIGAILMLFSDLTSQLPGYEKVLPINSVTALLGIPIVIWIVIKNFRLSK
jgi:iron complex transport system permease protein